MARIKSKDSVNEHLFNFRLDENLRDDLFLIAKKNDLTVSFILRRLIEMFLNNEVKLKVNVD